MFKLPDYEIIVWILCNEFGKKLEKEILSSIGKMPYESMEYQGVLGIHWDFDSWGDAVASAKNLTKFIDNPNLIFLRVNNLTGENASVVYKDERHMKKPFQPS